MKMRDKASGNATLQGSTRGKNVTERVERIEWNGCELEKTEQETESRRKSGVEVRKGPKFRHGNQERTAASFPQEIHLNQVWLARGENGRTYSTGQLGAKNTTLF